MKRQTKKTLTLGQLIEEMGKPKPLSRRDRETFAMVDAILARPSATKPARRK